MHLYRIVMKRAHQQRGKMSAGEREKNVSIFCADSYIMLLISNRDWQYEYLYLLSAIVFELSFLNTDIITDVHGIHTGGCESLQGGGLLHECE